ncbi:MAG: hypothetical protein M3R68_10135 [Acidobacteriota bacterium]|nr:hypothetical protein [Acidobacteriota bacterium]
MNQIDRLLEIVTTYQKHGWSLRRILLTAAAGSLPADETFAIAEVEAATIDAVWFSRPSHEQREAWELRLVAATPYALFETFEKDETEEQRAEMRREMEARMREHTTSGTGV